MSAHRTAARSVVIDSIGDARQPGRFVALDVQSNDRDAGGRASPVASWPATYGFSVTTSEPHSLIPVHAQHNHRTSPRRSKNAEDGSWAGSE